MRLFFAIIGLFLDQDIARAEPLELALTRLLATHPLVKSGELEKEAKFRQAQMARGNWFPTVSVQGGESRIDYGNYPAGNAVDRDRRMDLGLNQLLWDFGAANARIDAADLDHVRMERASFQQNQDLLLEGIKTYYGLKLYRELLLLAKRYEENTAKREVMERDRMEAGRGIATDILQLESQTMSARARRMQREDDLRQSIDHYVRLFVREPEEGEEMSDYLFPEEGFPKSLQDALERAMQENAGLAASRLATDVVAAEHRQAKIETFFPRVELTGSLHMEKDREPVLEYHRTGQVLAQAVFQFNTGLSGVRRIQALEAVRESRKEQAVNQEKVLEETVRKAWSSYETSKQRKEILKRLKTTQESFLELAREEREMGRRSLLDILSGENNLINAEVDEAVAENNALIAAYQVLHAMGQLRLPNTASGEKNEQTMLAPKESKDPAPAQQKGKEETLPSPDLNSRKDPLDPPSPELSQPHDLVGSGFLLKLGCFRSLANAEGLAERIRKQNLGGTLQQIQSKGETLHCVLTDPFPTRKEAQTAGETIRKLEKIDFSIRSALEPGSTGS